MLRVIKNRWSPLNRRPAVNKQLSTTALHWFICRRRGCANSNSSRAASALRGLQPIPNAAAPIAFNQSARKSMWSLHRFNSCSRRSANTTTAAAAKVGGCGSRGQVLPARRQLAVSVTTITILLHLLINCRASRMLRAVQQQRPCRRHLPRQSPRKQHQSASPRRAQHTDVKSSPPRSGGSSCRSSRQRSSRCGQGTRRFSARRPWQPRQRRCRQTTGYSARSG